MITFLLHNLLLPKGSLWVVDQSYVTQFLTLYSECVITGARRWHLTEGATLWCAIGPRSDVLLHDRGVSDETRLAEG